MRKTKKMQKLVRKYGSVLKAYRSQGGGAVGAMAAGIMLLVIGLIMLLLFLTTSGMTGVRIGAAFAVPGLLLTLLGMIRRRARVRDYLNFYQSETGYSVEELQAADRELMSPGAYVIAGRTNRAKEEVVFMITERYLMSVWPNKGCYLVKLEDIVAIFHSCQIPFISVYLEGVHIISKRDIEKKGLDNPLTKKQYGGYYNAIMGQQQNAEAMCMETVEEVAKRVPHVIRYQNIVVNGEKFDLLSMDNWQADWKRILEGLS